MKKTVESTMAGQPDKVCDQIADAIVDEYLRRDKSAHVDINVFGSHGMMMIGGETFSTADFDLGAIAKKVYADIGYTDDLEIFVNVEDQSQNSKHQMHGVYDSVVVNGYATAETRERLPRALVYAHNLARRVDELRKMDPSFSWLRPDGKVQITTEGDKVIAVTLLASHHLNIKDHEVQNALLERIIVPFFGEGVQVYINPIGNFTNVCFRSSSGMSGHKINVDTYGGLIPHGDGIISGKDPMHAERAGAYMARYVAKNIIDQELAATAFVQVVYTIGRAEPIHLSVTCMGETRPNGHLAGRESKGIKTDFTNLVKQKFDFRPEAIIERFDLQRPIYQQTALYGNFGRDGFPWEEKSVGDNI